MLQLLEVVDGLLLYETGQAGQIHRWLMRGAQSTDSDRQLVERHAGGTAIADTAPIDPATPPSGLGCVECLATDGWWFHLRRCAHCGHVGCCDSSPSQHASRHAAELGHPIAQSFEPGEDWFWDYANEDVFDGPLLAPPRHHPVDQPAPGPAGRVPPDWQDHLN